MGGYKEARAHWIFLKSRFDLWAHDPRDGVLKWGDGRNVSFEDKETLSDNIQAAYEDMIRCKRA